MSGRVINLFYKSNFTIMYHFYIVVLSLLQSLGISPSREDFPQELKKNKINDDA